MTTNDKAAVDMNSDAPKHPDSRARATEPPRKTSCQPKNLKAYEWAAKWERKPREVILAARRINLRVQNRLTRLAPVDAARILTEIENPKTDSEDA